MNKAILTGRLTKDPTVRYSQGETPMCIARFTLAVDRRRSRGQESNNQQTADFISCVAFGKTGEFVEKYAKKGGKFDICGHIQTGTYTNKDGNTVYTTDVVIDEIEFGESKGGGQQSQSKPQAQTQTQTKPAGDASSEPFADGLGEGFMNVPDEIEDELPFN